MSSRDGIGLRVPVWSIVLTVLDCLGFLTAWIWRAMEHAFGHAAPVALTPVYLVSAYVGLILGIYGFVVLGRLLHDAVSDGLQPAILCVLFATIPGCAAIVSLLSLLTLVGAKPV